MALLKVADFRTAQDGQSGYVLFKLTQPDGSISKWIGWQYVPIAGLASLQNILSSQHSYYDTEAKIFTTRSARESVSDNLLKALTLNPRGIQTPIKLGTSLTKAPKAKRKKV